MTSKRATTRGKACGYIRAGDGPKASDIPRNKYPSEAACRDSRGLYSPKPPRPPSKPPTLCPRRGMKPIFFVTRPRGIHQAIDSLFAFPTNQHAKDGVLLLAGVYHVWIFDSHFRGHTSHWDLFCSRTRDFAVLPLLDLLHFVLPPTLIKIYPACRYLVACMPTFPRPQSPSSEDGGEGAINATSLYTTAWDLGYYP